MKFSLLTRIVGLLFFALCTAKVQAAPTTFGAVNTLVVHGDSITAGLGASNPETTSWPARLKELIERYQQAPIRMVNLAVSGTDAVTQQESGTKITAEKPELVCILLGINDLRQARPLPEYLDAMNKIILDIKKGAPTATLILGSPTWMETYKMADPQWERWGQGTREIHLAYRDAVRKLAAQNGCLFADTYAALEGKPALIPDSVHPNDLGYQLIADRFFESLVLGQVPAAATDQQ